MIGILVKIPYFSQMRRSDPATATLIISETRASAVSSGARLIESDEGGMLLFEEGSNTARLRAAEALRRLEAFFSDISSKIHGYSLILESDAGDPENLRQVLKTLWLGSEGDGPRIGHSAISKFLGYIELADEPTPCAIRGFPYARIAERSSRWRVSERSEAHARLRDELETRKQENDSRSQETETNDRGKAHKAKNKAKPEQVQPLRNLILVSGSNASEVIDAAIGGVFGTSANIVRFAAGVSPSPLGPFVRGTGLSALANIENFMNAEESSELRRLEAVAKFIGESPFRARISPPVVSRFARYIAASLKLHFRKARAADSIPLVIFEGIDRYPEASLELAVKLLRSRNDAETRTSYENAIFIASETTKSFELKAETEGIEFVAIEAAPPSSQCIATAAQAAAQDAVMAAMVPIHAPGTTGEKSVPKREVESLAQRIVAKAEGNTYRLGLAILLASFNRLEPAASSPEELATAVLKELPAEFSGMLIAISLAEEALDDQALDAFFDLIGFAFDIKGLLAKTLTELGFIEGKGRPRLARPEIAAAAAAAFPGLAASIGKFFAQMLIALQASKSIVPSLALYELLETALGNPERRGLFFLDCLAADALYGSSRSAAAPLGGERLQTRLEAYGGFLEAYAESDERGCHSAIAAIEQARLGENSRAPLAEATETLARALDAYARGDAAAAALTTRPALIGLHSLGALRTEARAHRLLGLCSIATSQIQEGVGYLANAYELASLVPDSLESFFSAYAEAGANLVLGDIRRAAQRGAAAAAWAERSFRADWQAAIAFLDGRLAFEVGSYSSAEKAFDRACELTENFETQGASALARSTFWKGRSVAFAGDAERARAILRSGDKDPEDAEGLWFLAELSERAEDWETAARLSRAALNAAPRKEYRSADALLWDSGFESLEGRALGFCSNRSYLEDQLLAYSYFTKAMADKDASAVSAIAALTREERLAPMHPQAHAYLFYCWKILSVAKGGSLDSGTVLSKAFKALQVRAAHIDDATLKEGFYESNYLNHSLLATARTYKLI